MSANDNFSLHDDEELSLHDDASLNGSVPASNKGDAVAKPPQIITTNTLSNIKLPTMELKESRSPTERNGELHLSSSNPTAVTICLIEKERKARTLLLMAIPKDHLRRFHGMDDAKENQCNHQDKIWCNANTKKMRISCIETTDRCIHYPSKES
ncbi:hypothetical protein Tco_0669457 [Tanacetum coccineum]